MSFDGQFGERKINEKCDTNKQFQFEEKVIFQEIKKYIPIIADATAHLRN